MENTYNSLYNLTQVQGVDLDGDYDVTDPGEKKTVTCEEYDDAGRLTEFSYSWGRTIQLNRNDGSNDDPMLRVRRVRDVTKSLHNVAEYDYLGASRLKERGYYNTTELLVGHDSGGYVSGYDAYRRTVKFSNTGATDLPVFEYAYDNNSNRTSEKVTISATTKYNIFTYDNLNRITGAKYEADDPDSPSAWSKYTVFDLDLLGSRISVDDDINGSDAAGVQTTTYGNGAAAGCANDLHQYTAITLPDSSTVNPLHDDAGNQTDNDDDMQYKWDYLDRLAEIQDQSGTPKTIAEYVYDASGRRVLKEDYDGAGSAVELAVRYVYNGWQCIEEYEDPDGDGGGEGWGEIPARDYVYGNNIDEVLQYRCIDADEQGNVTGISGSDVTINDDQYAADELIGHYLVLWDTEDDPVAYMITDNAAGSEGATVVTVQVPGGENLSAFATSPEYAVMRAYYYHANVQGNVVAITDAAAGVVERITYDIYGRMTAVHADGSDLTPTDGFVTVGTYYTGSLTKNPYLFQGRRLDKESGLYYFRNRYYDPQHGRFLSRDPAGYADSYSLYQFVNNNPVCYVDPMGLSAKGDKENMDIYDPKKVSRNVEVLDMKVILWDATGESPWDKFMVANIDAFTGAHGFSHVSMMFKVKDKADKDKIKWIRVEATLPKVSSEVIEPGQKESSDAQFKRGLVKGGKLPVVGKDKGGNDIERGWQEVSWGQMKAKLPALKDSDKQRIYDYVIDQVGKKYDIPSFASQESTNPNRTQCSELLVDALDSIGIDTSSTSMREGINRLASANSVAHHYFGRDPVGISKGRRNFRKVVKVPAVVLKNAVAAPIFVARRFFRLLKR